MMLGNHDRLAPTPIGLDCNRDYSGLSQWLRTARNYQVDSL